MPTIDELRARRSEHAKQLEAVLWIKLSDLSARWGVDAETIAKISRDDLPYLEFGDSESRRYDPRDVEAYEASKKKGAAA